MRLCVLGGTGRTGRELLRQALERGHEVTALVRHPDQAISLGADVDVLEGDATHGPALERALEGQDAVLCALGPRSASALIRCDLMRSTMNALIPAMKKRGVSRVILLSALGVGQSAGDAPALLRLFFRAPAREVGRDKAQAEDRLRRSDLDWTVVYPPSLTDGPLSGAYRHGEALELRGIPKISRADVAAFMLAQLTDSSYSRRPAIVSP
jgi:putative NADH-flavin reductase